MKKYIVKHRTGNFENQPLGFLVFHALENRFWICECSTTPIADFVVEYPQEQQDCYWYYLWQDGKKLPTDPFEGRVQFSEERDNKGRRTVMYTPEQIAMRLSLIKWFALNVWIPDMQRLKNIDTSVVERYITDINAFTDDVLAKEYVVKNLYYDL